LIKNNVFSWIQEKYQSTRFTLLGPDIFAIKMQKHQNPLKTFTENQITIAAKLFKKKATIVFYSILLKTVGDNDKVKKKSLTDTENNVDKNTILENVTLHGSFIISHKSYFEYYSSFFDDRTFLYMEEHLLFQRCKKKNLKTVVCYDFQVIHLQGASTELVSKSAYKKKILRMKNEIASLEIYRQALKNN
jgi:GT2 family glycosyltransferase